jgi:hypothetical protein
MTDWKMRDRRKLPRPRKSYVLQSKSAYKKRE